MKVLVLGVKGMLGQELVNAFSGIEVVAWDREDLDITDKTQVFQKIAELRPDIILNSVAYNAVDLAEEKKDLAYAVNAEAVKHLALVAKEIGATFVHFSTDYVFEGIEKNGYKEGDAINPQSVYAKSKAKGEEYLREIGEKYYLIRLSRLFGKSGIGDGSKKSFVDVIFNLATEKKELEVVNEELSSPTYAPDLAKITKEIVANKMPCGIYHGANSGSCTWYEFADEALKLKNISCKLIPVPAGRFPRPAQRPKYSILLNTKLSPARGWQDALREYLKE